MDKDELLERIRTGETRTVGVQASPAIAEALVRFMDTVNRINEKGQAHFVLLTINGGQISTDSLGFLAPEGVAMILEQAARKILTDCAAPSGEGVIH